MSIYESFFDKFKQARQCAYQHLQQKDQFNQQIP